MADACSLKATYPALPPMPLYSPIDGQRPRRCGFVGVFSRLHGRPVDLSLRRTPMRALTLPADADLIRDYQDPTFVLGWTPRVR